MAAVVAVVCLWAALPAWGDVFLLESGGKVDGEWLNRDEQPLIRYLVRSGNVTITLPAGQVREAIRQQPAELEYARRAPLAADTVEGQWELAEWCRKSMLRKQREVHLRRIVELEPNHQAARFALGYQFLKGQWITKTDARRNEGYELYHGKWRTPQEIEILEARSRGELAEKEWLGRLKRWRKELDDRDKGKLAYESIAAIDDPVAVGPLGEYFAKERVRSVKVLYADVLATIKTAEAVNVLVERALTDPDEEIFHYCVKKLTQLKPPHVAEQFVVALKDNANGKVTRGAMALAKIQDKSVISPLIEALITTHTRVIDTGTATAAGFSGGSAAMAKGDGLVATVYHVHNQPVLDALSKLTGADFGFDKQAWRVWYAQEKIAREKIAQERAPPGVGVGRN